MSDDGYDNLVWVVLWVERSARLAAALDMQVCPGEGGISGAVASAIKKDADGEPYLTVTKELLREARLWRLRQAKTARLTAGKEPELDDDQKDEAPDELTPEPEPAPEEEAVTTAAAALGAIFSGIGAPVEEEPVEVEEAEAPEAEAAVEEEEEDPFAAIFARARARRQAHKEAPLSEMARKALAQLQDLTGEGAPVRSRELATHCACRRAEIDAALLELEGQGKAARRGEGWVIGGAPTETVRVRDAGKLVAVLEVERVGERRTYLDPATGQVWDSLEAARRDLLTREVI